MRQVETEWKTGKKILLKIIKIKYFLFLCLIICNLLKVRGEMCVYLCVCAVIIFGACKGMAEETKSSSKN